MGRARPGDMGFDIVHYNLHKTFTQPHGGGGPGAGPIAVSDRIEPYLTKPQVVKRDDGSFDLDYDRPKSIGRLRGFQGNYGVFVRSYAYILSLGGDGLQEASETAIGPAPGPPPPCGWLNDLCRLTWTMSKPMSPGRDWPITALRLAPS